MGALAGARTHAPLFADAGMPTRSWHAAGAWGGHAPAPAPGLAAMALTLTPRPLPPVPHGAGLVKNLAISTHVTTEVDETPVRRLCFALGVQDHHLISSDDLHDTTVGAHYVWLNGLILGVHMRPQLLCDQIRTLRRRGVIGQFISVQLHPTHRTINIASDSGRVCRPLVIVSSSTSLLEQRHVNQVAAGNRSFESLVTEGIIEYLDVNEENSAEIAVSEVDLAGPRGHQCAAPAPRRRPSPAPPPPLASASPPPLASAPLAPRVPGRYTHMEIDPLTILGAVAGLIPYPHHNQSPRNTYQCAMGKQAMGVIAHNVQDRFDTIMYSLHYPQKPLVKTRTLDLIGYHRLPAGHNATVAVMVRPRGAP